MAKLYELAAELQRLDEEMHSLENEGDGLRDLGTELAKVEMEFSAKVDGIVRWIRNLESDAVAYDTEADRLWALAVSAKNKVDSLKSYLTQTLEQLGMKRHSTEIAKLTLLAPKPRLEVDPDQAYTWPEDVYTATCTARLDINKSKLKKDFADRLETLPGCKISMGPCGLLIR